MQLYERKWCEYLNIAFANNLIFDKVYCDNIDKICIEKGVFFAVPVV